MRLMPLPSPTPGDWLPERLDGEWCVRTADYHLLARGIMSEADARVMAAGKVMLATLEDIVAVFQADTPEEAIYLNIAHAAIAAATTTSTEE
jgi:hypothetical protein